MDEKHDDHKIATWGELLTRTVELGLGAATLTAETAQKVVNDLVNRGKVASEESSTLVDKLLAMGKEQREMLMDAVQKGSERAMVRMDLARRSDLEALRQRVAALELAVLGHTTITEAPITPITQEEMGDNE